MDNNTIFVNDLLEYFDREKIIEYADNLKKDGVDSKKIKIKCNCKVCGKEVIVIPYTFKKQKNFCCDEHIRHSKSGKDSKLYDRITIECTNCGKQYDVIKYDYNKKNKFGDNHNFCCQQCYWDYRRKYYVGEKGAMYNHKYTDEQIKNISIGLAKVRNNTNRLDTSIQISVNDMLDSIGVEYKREELFGYYNVDNYLIKSNLIIEVMGDYWHANPLIYNENNRKMNDIQLRTITKDKQKRSYILSHHNIKILNLWECDIKYDNELCLMLIKLYIDNNGMLDNYNSFNYHIEDGKIVINNNIIQTYQEKDIKEYRNIAS